MCERKDTDTLLEGEKIVLRQGVGLGNDGDKVDACPKTLHNFNVQRFQTVRMSVKK